MLIMADKQGNVIVEVYNNRYDRQVEKMSTHLRQSDFDEIYAVTGESPHFLLMESWEESARRWIMFNKKCKITAVLGVRPTSTFSDTGIPWLLGTDDLDSMKLFFVKVSKPIIREMQKNFTKLVNHVDARYTKAVRWLKWCGFKIEEPEPFGEMGLPFHKFTMEST